MLTCKDLAARAGRYLDRDLSWRERMSVRFHLFLCDNCRRYLFQLRLMLAALRGRALVADDQAVARVMARIARDQAHDDHDH